MLPFPLHSHPLWGVLYGCILEVRVEDGRPLEICSLVVPGGGYGDEGKVIDPKDTSQCGWACQIWIWRGPQ